MDGRGERGGRRGRPAASRGRGAVRAAARSSSLGRGRSAGGGPGEAAAAAASLRGARRDGSAGRRGPPARRGSVVRNPPASPAAGGGDAPAAPRSRAAAAGAPAARRRAAVPDGAVVPSVPAAASSSGGLRLREVLSRLSLGRQDVSEASGLVNQVVSQLIQAIRSQEGSFGSIERLGAGSYYEHVKVGAGAEAFKDRHVNERQLTIKPGRLTERGNVCAVSKRDAARGKAPCRFFGDRFSQKGGERAVPFFWFQLSLKQSQTRGHFGVLLGFFNPASGIVMLLLPPPPPPPNSLRILKLS